MKRKERLGHTHFTKSTTQTSRIVVEHINVLKIPGSGIKWACLVYTPDIFVVTSSKHGYNFMSEYLGRRVY